MSPVRRSWGSDGVAGGGGEGGEAGRSQESFKIRVETVIQGEQEMRRGSRGR